VLVVQNLRSLQTDETYQAWVIEPTGPRSAGLFTVNERGWGMTTLTIPYSPGSAIGVSLESVGGNDQPTEVVLVGGL
jgi:anti-sigma-K factor RskA